MKATKITYYISTGLLSLSMLSGAFFELTFAEMSKEMFIHLGYPLYIGYILGVSKILGVIALWLRQFPTLREWAYAGFVIDLLGAIASHLFVGDPISAAMPAVINLVFVAVSYITLKKLERNYQF